jgi:glutamine amidotransferase
MADIAIIDYGLCNLDSMARAVEECGGIPKLTRVPQDIATADRLILPGVGAFAKAMENLTDWGLNDAIRNAVTHAHKPLLGVCLGMQLLAKSGEEGGGGRGLGLVDAKILKMQSADPNERIPHIGWNEVNQVRPSPLLNNAEQNSDYYFVHSFHMECTDPSIVVGETPYCGSFVSIIESGNIFGTQFHPEKSQRAGFKILKNFLNL